MKDHIIVCGYGSIGRDVVRELMDKGVDLIVIDQDPERIKELENIGLVGIIGDATKKETLEKAGIDDAKSLISVLREDASNAFVVLTARLLNPGIRIISKAEVLESIDKMYRIGASKVVSPQMIGGKMLAKSAVIPFVADFLDRITLMEDFEIVQFTIHKNSSAKGRTLREVRFREITGAFIIGIWKKGNLNTNPSPDEVLEEGSIILAMGTQEELKRVREVVEGA